MKSKVGTISNACICERYANDATAVRTTWKSRHYNTRFAVDFSKYQNESDNPKTPPEKRCEMSPFFSKNYRCFMDTHERHTYQKGYIGAKKKNEIRFRTWKEFYCSQEDDEKKNNSFRMLLPMLDIGSMRKHWVEKKRCRGEIESVGWCLLFSGELKTITLINFETNWKSQLR